MAQITDYGKKIKKRLIDIGQTQEWLIRQVTENTGMFFDAGYLYKISIGERNPPKIITAINDILNLELESITQKVQ